MTTFIPSPTGKRFMLSDARRRIIEGPFRSGKSVLCCLEIMRRAAQQAPGPDGIRRTRWAIVRNTVRMLMDTTHKTWIDWIPVGLAGAWMSVQKTFLVRYDDVYAEVMFRALDDPTDVANLLSLELTGAYLNEAREIHRDIVEGLDARIGQYPRKENGGCTWRGIFGDTNPPSELEYWYYLLENIDPTTFQVGSGWEVFKQPSGLSPDAENAENLEKDYYKNLAIGKSEEYVRVYIKNEYGKSKGGKPVHPLFDEHIHVANSPLTANPLRPLVLAADFGRTPAIVFMQEDVTGRVTVLDEIVTDGMGLDRCLKERAKPLIRERFQDYDIRVTGDPSGAFGTQTDEKTCVDIFRRNGFKRVKFAKSNNPIERQGALDYFLVKRPEAGGILLDPRCLFLKRALSGGYHWVINRKGLVSAEPEKTMDSHIAEACQYGCMFFQQGIESKVIDQQVARVLAAQKQAQQYYGSYALRR